MTARGFNGRFTNKLQVLGDGRSTYQPLFSDTGEQGATPLEDIERIEVIRGLGASSRGDMPHSQRLFMPEIEEARSARYCAG